ncbi:MAG: hypothetical protein CVT89_04355, partial [Candidatus Altiarchaeales archaeon HGW-Altiarchaeales-2]
YSKNKLKMATGNNAGAKVKKSVFDMDRKEFVGYMNSKEITEFWNKKMEEAEEEALKTAKAARNYWVR